jgi:uncharacterized protein YndB with AHSA1/START domain
MAKHAKPSFSYHVHIAATPDSVWRALTDGVLTRQYWYGRRAESDWKVGSPVTFWYDSADGEAVSDRGIVLESVRPRRLSYTWQVQFKESMRDENPSRVTFEIEPEGEDAKLTVTHDDLEAGGEVLPSVRNGWPAILCSLKSLLETGEPLALTNPAPATKHAAA